jgi:hypothetical protein
MPPIDHALLFARDACLPGREAATLNELCRAIVAALRRPSPKALVERLVPTDNVIALRRR